MMARKLLLITPEKVVDEKICRECCGQNKPGWKGHLLCTRKMCDNWKTLSKRPSKARSYLVIRHSNLLACLSCDHMVVIEGEAHCTRELCDYQENLSSEDPRKDANL
jgi:hypothetical protein